MRRDVSGFNVPVPHLRRWPAGRDGVARVQKTHNADSGQDRLCLVLAVSPHFRGQENMPSPVLLLVQRDLQPHKATVSMEFC